ncbi:MAG: endonuclease Q family protein [Patescibacteria group bacterium]
MQYIADLHIHSKYSRACSPLLTLENIAKYCVIKGVDLVGTADFTHPVWFAQMQENLVEDTPGIYKFKGSRESTRFLISTEVSCIYSQGGKVRRLHIVVFAPSLEIAQKINQALSKIGNLNADGRPILGLSAKKLAEIVWEIDPECLIIPAHAWTPWFAIFGSKSGFDSLSECFEEYTDRIYAIETGLSSDPAMNWRLSFLDKITLISSSDAHSLPNIGREANVFNLGQLTYNEICAAIKSRDKKKFLYTIEFYPEEGMYHYDGHRDCGIVFTPVESKKHQNICPVCKKPLTVGVLNRVAELADRPEGFVPPNSIPFISLVELDKIIAESFNIKSRRSKAVQAEYDKMIKKGKNELNILLNLSYDELGKITTSRIVEGVKRMRECRLIIQPGYDGVYGKVEIFKPEERSIKQQTSLF